MKTYINIFLFITLSFASARAEEKSLSKNEGHPVIGLFKDTLFFLHTKEGSFSIKERANAITNRIIKISEEPFFKKENLKLQEVNQEVEI